MFSRSGEVKVADFGLSRVIKNDGMNLTQAGITMGTPLYMSPEQIEGRPVDSRSDIYSLGVTAYQMLAGEVPFKGDTPLSVAVQHLNKSPEPLGIRSPSVPPGLARIVDRMLAKKPVDRFQTPFELLSELRELAKRAAQEGWAEGPDNWSLSELLSFGEGRNEVTQRLTAAMKTTAMAALPRWRAKCWIALAVAALVAGLVIAALTKPRLLLADTEERPEQQENVRAQLFHAKVRDTPDAWKAVIDYFPTADPFDLNLAKQGLVRVYLRDRDYSEAQRTARELAGDSDLRFKAFGMAGQVIALTSQAQSEAEAGRNDQALKLRKQAREISGEISSDWNQQLDQGMSQQLNEARNELARN